MKQIYMFGPESFERAKKYAIKRATISEYSEWDLSTAPARWIAHRTDYAVLRAPDRRHAVTQLKTAEALTRKGFILEWV
jgi:hypothetical protein